MREADLFAGAARVTMNEAMEMTAASLGAYGPTHPHWFVAWSGGKDSTATLLTDDYFGIWGSI
jgi:DNA sulfur modification protein DndC